MHVERRAADDLEHVGGGRLLLEGFAQLVEQASVLDGDDGLAAKLLTSAICLSVNGRTSWRKMEMVPTNLPSLSIGTLIMVRAPARSAMATTTGSPSR